MRENVKSYSQNWGAKTKSYIIPTVEQKLDNITQDTGANDSNNICTSEEIARWLLIIAMTCKMDANSVLKSVIVPRSDKPNEKASKANSILRHECNARNMCFVDN